MQPIWRVEMFGTLRASMGEQTLTRFRTRRVALLLAFLSYHRSREYTREELGEMLWPEQDEEAVRRNLRQAIHSLRHALEPPPLPGGSILLVKQSRVFLDHTLVTSDVAEFERLVGLAKSGDSVQQLARSEQALDLYRGEFLPGFYEEWVLRERLRMEDLYVSCLRNAISLSKSESRHDEAILYLRRALTQEPLREDWHSDLMEQYLKADRPAGALKQYAELQLLLKEQLGCEPSARSKSLADTARRASTISTQRKPHAEETNQKPEVARTDAPVDGGAHRLPLQMTRFFGRTGEIEGLRSEFANGDARLVTLLGPAGTGKTRLAIEVGREMSAKERWNVWFAPLADLSDASMLLDEIADVLSARQPSIPELLDQIAASVKGDINLLILDNLEHIVDASTPLVAELMARVPNLRLLVTSRQPLKLEGEREFPVDPLPVPSVVGTPRTRTPEQLADLAQYPSVQVFLDRSQAIRPDAQLTPSNAATIVAICAKLEGIPLAIELAAGQTGSISPSQMLKHLERRLTALSTRRRDATARHRSLRAAIDYSFESLPPNLQRFFSALSTFRGGFTVESALEVSFEHGTDADASPHEACLESILDLQERSLLRADVLADAPDPRFRILESFRQYGEEHLAPGELEALRRRHFQFFLTRFGDLPEHASIEEHTQQHRRMESEHENFVAALEFAFQSEDYENCIRLLDVMAKDWTHRGPRVIEREYIRQLAILTRKKAIDSTLHIRLLRMLGTTYIRASDYAAAHRAMEAAVEVALKSGDDDLIATCYVGLSTCAGFMGEMRECFELNEKALVRVSPNNYELIERIYLGLGAVHWAEARLAEADQAFRRAKEASELARGGESDALILFNLARTSLDLDRPDDAMSYVGHAIRICQRLGDPYTLAQCLYMVSRYHWLRGDTTAALATNHEALMLGQDVVFGFLSLFGVRNHALILSTIKEWETAATLLAATHSLLNMHRTLDDRDFATARERCIDNLPRIDYERAWAKGLGMSVDEALQVAIHYK